MSLVFHTGIIVCLPQRFDEEGGGDSHRNVVADKRRYSCGNSSTHHSATSPGRPKFSNKYSYFNIMICGQSSQKCSK